MAEFFPYIKPNYIDKKGKTPVYIRYNYDRRHRIFIPLGIKIEPQYWDDAKQKIKKSCKNHEKINSDIQSKMTKIGLILDYAKEKDIDPTIDFIKHEIALDREIKTKRAQIDLMEELDDFIESSKTRVSNNTIKDYKSLKHHLTGFQAHTMQKLTFKDIHYQFYLTFMDYLLYHAKKPDETIGLLSNSAGKQIKILKAFIKNRVQNKIIPPIDLTGFIVEKEDGDHIYLNEKEIKKIYDLDFSENKQWQEIRDVFVVGCYTGLRYSDLYALTRDKINKKEQLIYLKQKKVHEPVIIPLIDYVPEIMEKYNYDLPHIPSHEFNIEIKEICKEAEIDNPIVSVKKRGNQKVETNKPKYKMVSSHTCRRSFCTNMYLSGIPAEELMKISGHKTYKAFMTYIKVDNYQAANRLKMMREKIKQA